jgi:hypothetical protein
MFNYTNRVNFNLFVILIITILAAKTSVVFGQCDFEWNPISGGMNGGVLAFTVYNGELIAGGWFSAAGDVDANSIARWDGNSWQPLGTGVNGDVEALEVYNGELIAAGSFFTTAGGIYVYSCIARWDGSGWQPLGGGITAGNPGYWANSLTVYNGELIVGGSFNAAGGVDARNIARWNGNSWQPLGGGVDSGGSALTVYNGELIMGGGFTEAYNSDLNGGFIPVTVNYIARWDGSNWHPLGSGMDDYAVEALTVYNGELIAGGPFTIAGGVDANHIAHWDGSNWQPLGSGMSDDGQVLALTVYNSELIAGGDFTTAGGVDANNIARWDGSNWQPLGSGMGGAVHALTIYNGSLIAGGGFVTAGGVSANNIARWGLPEVYTGDLNHDCAVDWLDLSTLVDNWLREDCTIPDWCEGADLNVSTNVDFYDFAEFANNWLKGL